MSDHEKWMRLALEEAHKAYEKEEVPVGAVVVCDGRVVGTGHNLTETLQDASAHAEMLAITAASGALASWRLESAELYVTLEPCPMCCGAIILSRLPRVVFGAYDRRFGACGSAIDLPGEEAFGFRGEVLGGVLANDCRTLIQNFFDGLRKRAPQSTQTTC